MKEVSTSRLDTVIDGISGSPEINLSNHCLLLFDTGGQSRRSSADAASIAHCVTLHAASPLPFPLSLIPSHHVLVGFLEPSSLRRAFDRLAPYAPSIIYAPTAFQGAFLNRLRSRRGLNLRARLGAGDYRDLLPAFGEDYFAVEIRLDYDTPLVEYRYGSAVSRGLQELLDTLG